MSLSIAIGSVSQSLRDLLLGEISLSLPYEVSLLHPDEVRSGKIRLNLYLYKIIEHTNLKNMDWEGKRGSPDLLLPPPLSLSLFYMMTPFPGTLGTGEPIDEVELHKLLGEAMRVFHTKPVLELPYLRTEEIDQREFLQILMKPVDMDELNKVWGTFKKEPYRLSVLYEISVVQIEAGPARSAPPVVRGIGAIEVKAPYRPPIIHSMDPVSGGPGTLLVFEGENLSDWSATIRIMDWNLRIPADGEGRDAARIEVHLPGHLPAGFHEVRVDVSNLYRRTFLFELVVVVTILDPLPRTGPAGSSLSFGGLHLHGLDARVRISSAPYRDEVSRNLGSYSSLPEPTGEEFVYFQADLPADLEAGDYEILIDILEGSTENLLYSRILDFTVV